MPPSTPDPDDDDDPIPYIEVLRNLAQSERDDLPQQADQIWQAVDAPSRREAPDRADFDPTREGRLLARYLTEADRTERLALAELVRHRKLDNENMCSQH